MSQQIATYEAVARVCDEMEARGENPTGDAVRLRLGGGSKGTVLENLAIWRRRKTVKASAAKEIPLDFQDAVMRLIGQVEEKAAGYLQKEIEDAESGEADAVASLKTAETTIEDLREEVAELTRRFTEYRQQAEKTEALLVQEKDGLRSRIEALETERRQLIDACESARTEGAKALLQIERADAATGKAESRVQLLEQQVASLTAAVAEADKGRAVAERHAEDLAEQLRALSGTLQRSQTETEQLRKDLDAAHRQAAEADKRAALVEQQAKLTAKKTRARTSKASKG